MQLSYLKATGVISLPKTYISDNGKTLKFIQCLKKIKKVALKLENDFYPLFSYYACIIIMMKILPKGIIPLYEYPRPQFERKSYLCLNGFWKCDFLDTEVRSDDLKLDILVPYSPESRLSRVKRQLKKNEYLHYRRYFMLPAGFNKGRIILNIGAIDQRSRVYINGKLVVQWIFGYLPISVDITEFVKEDFNNEIYIVVLDDADNDVFARGKQRYKRGGIWYTATSGIYQTVFLESVPKDYVKSIKINPDYDKGIVNFSCETFGKVDKIIVDVYDGKEKIGSTSLVHKKGLFQFSGPFKSWSPENPHLYDIYIRYKGDVVKSYFGMRKFGKININGKSIFTLNNKPYLFKGVLDQGYFVEGIYTVFHDKDYIKDIELMKNLGFNTLRKHIKIEPMRFYYHCDRLGMIVWQDFVNGGSKYHNTLIITRPLINYHIDDTTYRFLGRGNEKSRDHFYKEMMLTVNHLYNVPSLALWTIFNEGWGQFDSVKMTKALLDLDKTRLIDSTSGWYDTGVGDCCSRHIYFRPVKIKNDHKRVLVLSEFGGYSYYIKEHAFSSKSFGYKHMYSKEELSEGIYNLFVKELAPLISYEGLSAYIYTQLSDVEDEVNGFITYDRKVIKVNEKKIVEANDLLEKTFKETYKI